MVWRECDWCYLFAFLNRSKNGWCKTFFSLCISANRIDLSTNRIELHWSALIIGKSLFNSIDLVRVKLKWKKNKKIWQVTDSIFISIDKGLKSVNKLHKNTYLSYEVSSLGEERSTVCKQQVTLQSFTTLELVSYLRDTKTVLFSVI